MHKNEIIRWKSTLSFLKSAKLPWVHYILASVVPFLSTIIYVYLPELEGEIAAGKIFDSALTGKYVLLSVLLLMLNAATFYSAWVEIQFDRKIQKLTWKKLLLMPMRAFDSVQPSTLISRITDDSGYVSELINYIISLVLSVFSAVMMIASLFRMNVTLAMYTVPVMLANSIFVLIIRTRGYDIGFSIQDALSKYTSFLSERVNQLPLVKAMGTEEDEIKLGFRLSDERRRAEMKSLWYEILVAAAMEITNILLVGFILIGGSMLVRGGSMGMEKLVAFYLLAMSLPNTLQELQFQVLKMEQFRGAVEVISDIANMETEREGGKTHPEPLTSGIEFRDVTFGYSDGRADVLSGVSFTVPEGKTTAIVGPTGSGKTTILRLIERFYDAGSGDILYDGTHIEEFDTVSWRQRFGYIVQNSPIMSGTIRSNILYGAKEELSDEEIMRIAERTGLADFIDSLEDGLDTRVDGNGNNISGGQRQRIAIARALAADPEILIMDEATSNLDAYNVRSVSEAVSELMKGRTVIVVAHQMSTIRNADKIIVLDKGRVQAEGTHDELLRQDTYYSRYCRLQNTEA